ncbi:endothelial differentiation-related factor 1-like [Clytia hemisphaerica]|uniref:HTH cro/C1-type domain-containing protein n=1 Tax=Clytia hemisphaerica TaxID=252671 RepID=A0A7M5UR01_9CNID|eukprot:TCONS_00072215-protein
MAEVGWDDVTYLRKKTPKAAEARSSKAVNSAMRSGTDIETSKKYGGGGNKQHMGSRDSAAVCRDTEETKIETVSLDVGKLIQKGRTEKGLTQKELATRINEKPQVINDYEAGRAIPNNQILSKVERIIGLKLRGKDKGKPFGGPKGKK